MITRITHPHAVVLHHDKWSFIRTGVFRSSWLNKKRHPESFDGQTDKLFGQSRGGGWGFSLTLLTFLHGSPLLTENHLIFGGMPKRSKGHNGSCFSMFLLWLISAKNGRCYISCDIKIQCYIYIYQCIARTFSLSIKLDQRKKTGTTVHLCALWKK